MKNCPTCWMTVDVDNECPFCGTSLTYEPDCDAVREKIVWNKYYLLYMAKNIWFSLICVLIGVIKLTVARPPMSELLIAAIVCAAVSLLVALFQRSLTKGNWIYKATKRLFLWLILPVLPLLALKYKRTSPSPMSLQEDGTPLR